MIALMLSDHLSWQAVDDEDQVQPTLSCTVVFNESQLSMQQQLQEEAREVAW